MEGQEPVPEQYQGLTPTVRTLPPKIDKQTLPPKYETKNLPVKEEVIRLKPIFPPGMQPVPLPVVLLDIFLMII